MSTNDSQAGTLKDVRKFLEQNNTDLKYGLEYLGKVQSVTSAMIPDCIPAEHDQPTKEQVTTYFMALTVELMELLQELNWKPWKKSKVIDPHKVADEFADILAFLGIIIVYLDRLGISEEELAKAYTAKTHINISRFLGKVEGYGVSSPETVPDSHNQ